RFLCRLFYGFLHWLLRRCFSRLLFLIKFFRHRLLGCFRLAVLLLAVSFLTASAGAFGIFVLCLILSVTDYLCTNGGCSCCHRTQNCQHSCFFHLKSAPFVLDDNPPHKHIYHKMKHLSLAIW